VLDLVILELGKAKRLLKRGELKTEGHLKDWIKFFVVPNEVMEENEMDDLDERIKKAYEELQNVNLTEQEEITAERRYMNLLCQKNSKEGDINYGKQEGKRETQLEIAKKMKAKNKPIEEIMEFTELTKEEIEKL
jgi:predicted transposase/invertase (TIGR01784 family)